MTKKQENNERKRFGFFLFFLLIVFVISYLSCYFMVDQIENYQNLLRYTSEIIGLLFAGILTVLAIVFSLMRFKEISYVEDGIEDFKDFFNELKTDVFVIFICFVISIVFYLINPIPILTEMFSNHSTSILFIFTFIEVLIIGVTLECTFEVVLCLFKMNEAKMKIAENLSNEKKE